MDEPRIALVTGAARGIGRAVAERLAADGTVVAVNDLTATALGDVMGTLGQRGLAVPGDVGDPASVGRMVDVVIDRLGRLDILVTAAGILHPTRFGDIPLTEWQRTLDVNLTGVFLSIQAVLQAMTTQGYGRIVTISSTAGKSVSTLGGAHYTASKAGVLGLTRAAAKELGARGITVNAVCPGLIDTEMVRASVTPERLDAYQASFPILRLGTPEEVAELVAFLASERAGYVTGAAFDITGGDLLV